MKSGTLIYKCRRCSNEDRHIHTPLLLQQLINIAFDGKSDGRLGQVAKIVELHQCPNGQYGICDLIGGDED